MFRTLSILLSLTGAAFAQTGEGPAGTWLAEDIGGGGVVDRVRTTLVLGTDGAVSGNGGCNQFGGSARIDGGRIEFGQIMSTMMACPEAVMDQERRFHEALAAARAWRVEETGHLVLLDGDGAELARLIGNS